jgi:rhodanese-related sulfurtransferase
MSNPTIMIDVRERDEFESEHIEDSINVPLSQFAMIAPGVLKSLQDRELVFMCRSGKRAALALSEAKGIRPSGNFSVFEGGILNWIEQGKPVISLKKVRLPLMRQVQIIAGFLVVIGTLLAWTQSIEWLALAGFVGAGLMFAGITGFCGMAEILQKMPWNKGVSS